MEKKVRSASEMQEKLFQESVCGVCEGGVLDLRRRQLHSGLALTHASPSGHCCLSQGWAFKQSLLRAVQLAGHPTVTLASSLS